MAFQSRGGALGKAMSHSPQPLRVLTLATLFPDARRPVLGTFVERQTLGLAEAEGVEVRIIVPRGLPPWPLDRHAAYRDIAALPDEELWQGRVKLYRPRFLHIPKWGAGADVGFMVRALVPLLTRIRRDFAFDVIDAEYFFPDGPAAVRLGAHFGVPVSIKARGSDIHLWGRRRDTAALVRDAGVRADGLLAVSAALKADMVGLGMAADKIRVHYTGVDHALFRPRDRAVAQQALGVSGPLVVTIGTLDQRKGQDLVIQALAQLPGVTLALMGKGPQRAGLQALARDLGVADRVRFLGSLARADVADWLAAADVMALPSMSEGLANAWVEALASGTPVVASDVGGVREVVRAPVGGRIVARAADAVRAAIADLLAAPPSREAVAASVDDFSWQRNTEALAAHLRGLVRNAAGGLGDPPGLT